MQQFFTLGNFLVYLEDTLIFMNIIPKKLGQILGIMERKRNG
jgi:hypothetical protein